MSDDVFIMQGDCLEKLKEIPDNSMDAIVTDPPYGISFMGKKWDYDVPSVDIWKECFRVLKPGGFLLSFAGTRTQHRMAVNIEDAGFEIRDMIAWVYGSGFPKSYNIGKGIEGILTNGSASWNDFHKLNGELGDSQSQGANGLVKLNSSHGNRPKQYASHGSLKLEPTTDEAKMWNGWGTALKPALEPITMARKPLSEKNVAKNVLKWGTAGLNIDECRIPFDKEQETDNRIGTDEVRGSKKGLNSTSIFGCTEKGVQMYKEGRFPANLIHDGSDEVTELFPTSSVTGKRSEKSVQNCIESRKEKQGNSQCDVGGNIDKITEYTDKGSTARFFYCAKVSKKEKSIGLNGKNNHPTVKPLKLMEYLVRLVTREGALVLDPFMGSGTTGMACKTQKRRFIGIDLDKDYCEIAKKRIEGVENE